LRSAARSSLSNDEPPFRKKNIRRSTRDRAFRGCEAASICRRGRPITERLAFRDVDVDVAQDVEEFAVREWITAFEILRRIISLFGA